MQRRETLRLARLLLVMTDYGQSLRDSEPFNNVYCQAIDGNECRRDISAVSPALVLAIALVSV
jgi:hypothetical protein